MGTTSEIAMERLGSVGFHKEKKSISPLLLTCQVRDGKKGLSVMTALKKHTFCKVV